MLADDDAGTPRKPPICARGALGALTKGAPIFMRPLAVVGATITAGCPSTWKASVRPIGSHFIRSECTLLKKGAGPIGTMLFVLLDSRVLVSVFVFQRSTWKRAVCETQSR